MVQLEELAGRTPRGRAKRRFMGAAKEDRRLADDGDEDARNKVSWKQMIGSKAPKGTAQRGIKYSK